MLTPDLSRTPVYSYWGCPRFWCGFRPLLHKGGVGTLYKGHVPVCWVAMREGGRNSFGCHENATQNGGTRSYLPLGGDFPLGAISATQNRRTRSYLPWFDPILRWFDPFLRSLGPTNENCSPADLLRNRETHCIRGLLIMDVEEEYLDPQHSNL